MTDLIDNMLTSNAALVLARLVISSFFLVAGMFGLRKFNVIVGEMRDAKLPSPKAFAVATIATQLIGSGLLITNIGGLAWLGAGALGVFTLLCIPIAHPFWRLAPTERMPHFQVALEHLALTGGLALAAIASR
jgi:transmembrane protein